MVANGEKMHAILIATQEDAQTSRDIAEQSKEIAEQSRILAEEMKQDSVAMKTVCVECTLNAPADSGQDRCNYYVFPTRNIFRGLYIFFPAYAMLHNLTLLQALLAMPFFNSNKYLDDLRKVWIWIVCTVPSTAMAFAFYFYWRHGEDRRRNLSAALSRPRP